jgi:hypothetical protein
MTIDMDLKGSFCMANADWGDVVNLAPNYVEISGL